MIVSHDLNFVFSFEKKRASHNWCTIHIFWPLDCIHVYSLQCFNLVITTVCELIDASREVVLVGFLRFDLCERVLVFKEHWLL